MLAKLHFPSSSDNQAHQIFPNQGLNMLLSAKNWSTFAISQGRIKTFNAKHGFGTLEKREFVVIKGGGKKLGFP